MKKRSFVGLISVALAMVMLCSVFLSGCGLFGGDNNNDDNNNTTPTEYTIQYTDDVGTHTLTVTDGATYSLEVIPERTGYDFLGLFDAEVGGTQYVTENGSSLAPFTDKKNMVLFPQFAAKEYTVVLDYQGAAVTGQRSLTVKYNEKLPELPKNLSKEHSVFAGWYTEENCGGTQVADAYGLIPDKSTLNESLFDIDGAGEYLYLYAGFDVETFTVTFNFGNGIPSEEVEVEYNTPISEVVPETRNSEGQAVLSWSKTSSGEQIFTGNITDDIVLYATEWAPVIELDLNGGEGKNAVVAREGATVALPTPVRENYKFLHWETMSGEEANITKMPADGAQLKAVWQAMLVFDENGGTEVNDISQEAGTAITLPTPEKEGFIFAGWYNADEEKYESKSMPSASVELKAGWYQAKTKEKVFLPEGENSSVIYDSVPVFLSKYRINLAEDVSEFDWTIGGFISFTFHADIRHAYYDNHTSWGTDPSTLLYATNEHFLYYSQEQASDTYLLGSNTLNHGNNRVNTTFTGMDWTTTLNIPSNGIIYIALASDKKVYDGGVGGYEVGWRMTNFYVTIHYPDTTNLYL